jgi:outer membrane receptor for ferrienterochelin and colicins
LANVRQDIYSYINIGEFNTMGTNIALSYVRSDLNSKIGFSYTGRQYKANQVVGSTDVVFTPEIMGNIIYDLPIAELRLNAFYKYTGKLVGFFAVSDVEYAQFEVDDYHTLDLTLSRNFFDNLVMVNFGLKNIFDVKDVERSATGTGGVHSDSGTSNPISWGRTITASIRINVN